ncbi:Ypt/Rab-GAP domain of gyp1p superfamily protein [Striga asiatica]|uniref:Ypt/Rab-GAP domain of gyp1p superfamily protein n=1 Tax=Striga asiatica TaxID=4170 RepID=A0A5A7QEJ0_STRAF|nr:Ypt/Rab-GAP domain of gyp1p superfamily protein [Striga asiatica]
MPKRRRPSCSSSSSPPFLNSLPSSKADFGRLIAVVSFSAVVAAACHLIASSLMRPPKPFCDSATSDSDYWLPAASDYCEPCPSNGICDGGKLKCVDGYIKQGKFCIEDGDINKAAENFAKWVQNHVCEAYAQQLCTGAGKCWVSEGELLNNLNEYKEREDHGMDEAVFMPAKQKAMKNIRSILETKTDNHGVQEFKCPELLVNSYKPLSCVVRQWIVDHALLSISALTLFLGCTLITSRVYHRHRLRVRAEQLYHEVCDILEEKPLVSRSVGSESETWVVASWLRDHLLSPMERKDPFLWRKVEELVQEDSRVDQYPKLVKGESKVVWEWQAEASLGSSGKRKRSNVSTPQRNERTNSSSNLQRRIRAGELQIE